MPVPWARVPGGGAWARAGWAGAARTSAVFSRLCLGLRGASVSITGRSLVSTRSSLSKVCLHVVQAARGTPKQLHYVEMCCRFPPASLPPRQTSTPTTQHIELPSCSWLCCCAAHLQMASMASQLVTMPCSMGYSSDSTPRLAAHGQRTGRTRVGASVASRQACGSCIMQAFVRLASSAAQAHPGAHTRCQRRLRELGRLKAGSPWFFHEESLWRTESL
jgi:hypothetical protein